MEFDQETVLDLLGKLKSSAAETEEAADYTQSQAQDVERNATEVAEKAGCLQSDVEALQALLSDESMAELLTSRQKINELQERYNGAIFDLKNVLKDLGCKFIEPEVLEAVKREARIGAEGQKAKFSELEQAHSLLKRQVETLKALIDVKPQAGAFKEADTPAAG